ncbi:MAG TPA: response regulator transcription factor [Verrucomicrobiae bacterium]|jgi:DNA-binding NarL/FixJ family response regulator
MLGKIQVLLADDHTVVRQGLRALLEAEADIRVVAEADNGRQAVQLAKKFLPAVVIMDIAMPNLNGLEATRQITKDVPGTKLLVLSSYNDDEYVIQVIKAGAKGYLLKQTAATELINAVREVSRGNPYFSPAISRRLVDENRDGKLDSKKHGDLTSREMEVLQLIAEGNANKQIAAELNISIKTVEKHRQQVMNKLNIHDIAGLTRYAISKGIVERPIPEI